jgi:3-hydroxybutyryl-CoA dehydrogenase
VVDAPAAAPAPATGRPLVGVAGSGHHALQIIETCARAGAEVRFLVSDDGEIERVLAALREALDRPGSGGALEEPERKAALDRVTGGSEQSRLAGCDLVIDAAGDDTAAWLGALAGPDAILAVSVFTTSVIEQAMATGRPESVVGLRFAPHPADEARPGTVAEVVTTALTSAEAAGRAAELAGLLGLVPVRCRDRAGLIIDALRFPYLNDAARMLEAGYADADSIDAAMRLGCGYPAGPIAELDRFGPALAARVLQALHAESRQPALAPAPLLEEYATAGRTLR